MSLVTGLVPIDEVVYFDVCTHNPSTGAVSDADATPTFDVYEEATDTGLLGATNFTKRTSLTGNYRGTFTASAANGFEAGKWYSVIASATVNSIAAKKNCGSFRVAPAETQAGVPKIDVAYWIGTASLLVGGLPSVNATTITAGIIAAATFAANALDAVWSTATRALTDKASFTLSSTGNNSVADALLDRDMSTGTDSGSTTVRTPRQALRALRNKTGIAGNTLTVTKENDVTASWTATVTTAAGDPLSEIDPAGP